MTLHRLLLTFALLAAAYPTAPGLADTPSSNLQPDILYTHRGEFIQVKPMRPLTLNAHVAQFAYDPLGIEIAIVGSDVQGDETAHFVKTLDARTGQEISRFAVTGQTSDDGNGLSLLGWSPSGKYLLLQQFSPDVVESGTVSVKFLRLDLSAKPPVTRVIDPQAALTPEEQSADLEGSANAYPSPDGRWLLLGQSIHTVKPNGKPLDQNAYILYDSEHDTYKVLALPPKIALSGEWGDKTHFKLWQDGVDKWLDVATGQITPAPASPAAPVPLVSSAYPDLSLDTQSPVQQDAQSKDGHLGSYLIWIRRTPFGKRPLGVCAAGLMPTSGDADDDPKAAWSPTGKQVAFVANRDLYVTDLKTVTRGLPREKMAVGLKPSCEDELSLASSDLKQIGLAIVQYTQDNDENLPQAEGFVKTIYPYIKLSDVFDVDGHPVVYEQPANLALAAMPSPADTEQAYIDLPCARVVLFCDGHVRVFKK